MRKLSAFLCIAVLVLLALAVAGCASTGSRSDTGTLMGTVSVGPVVPDEHGVMPPAPDPSVFTSRKLLLYDADGKTLLQEIPIQPPPPGGYQGTYNVTLKPGTYKLGYDYMGGVRFIPSIPIEAGKTMTVDVFIDTGIR